MLPAAVRRVGRLVERIGVVWDVAHEDAVYGTFVNVEDGHLCGGNLRGGRFLERGDKAGDAAVVPVANRIHWSRVVKAGDGLDQPDRDVAGVHHLGKPL